MTKTIKLPKKGQQVKFWGWFFHLSLCAKTRLIIRKEWIIIIIIIIIISISISISIVFHSPSSNGTMGSPLHNN
jgi:hypothetical protein